MNTLTETQHAILEFIADFQILHGRTPNGPEIAESFDYSAVTTAYEHLRLIEKKGYLSVVQPGTRRPLQIQLTAKARPLLETTWPALGQIPAGPIFDALGEEGELIQRVEDLLPMVRPNDFFLTVDGDSMIDAGLRDGMTLLMRPDPSIQPGDICAVWVEGDGGTLKKVYPEGETIQLVPANEEYEAKTYSADRIQVQGVLVAALDVRLFRSG